MCGSGIRELKESTKTTPGGEKYGEGGKEVTKRRLEGVNSGS